MPTVASWASSPAAISSASSPPLHEAPRGRPAVTGAPDRAVWCESAREPTRHNVVVLRELVAPAAFLAVVKANGYGHGAVPVARAALDAGAAWLGGGGGDGGAQVPGPGVDAPAG